MTTKEKISITKLLKKNATSSTISTPKNTYPNSDSASNSN